MSETVLKPVVLDETAKMIAANLHKSNSLQQDTKIQLERMVNALGAGGALAEEIYKSGDEVALGIGLLSGTMSTQLTNLNSNVAALNTTLGASGALASKISALNTTLGASGALASKISALDATLNSINNSLANGSGSASGGESLDTVPIFIVPMFYNDATGEYSVLDNDVTVSNITDALHRGHLPVLQIYHVEQDKSTGTYHCNAYYIAYSKTSKHPSTGVDASYVFYKDKNCPDGAIGSISIVISNEMIITSKSYEVNENCRCVVVYGGVVGLVDGEIDDLSSVYDSVIDNIEKTIEREQKTLQLAMNLPKAL